jgi:hypothetical protein
MRARCADDAPTRAQLKLEPELSYAGRVEVKPETQRELGGNGRLTAR